MPKIKRLHKCSYILVCFKCKKWIFFADKDFGSNKKFAVKNIYKNDLDVFLSCHLTCFSSVQCIANNDHRYDFIVDGEDSKNGFEYQD